jgi:hypothetical protein
LTAAILGGIGSESIVFRLLNDERIKLSHENLIGGELYYHVLELPSTFNYRNRVIDTLMMRSDFTESNFLTILDLFPDESVVEQVRLHIAKKRK